MPNAQKVQAVKELAKRFETSSAALVAEFRGMKVSEMKELRVTLRDAGAEFHVVKNTLTRLAATQANLEDLIPLLEGSTAIAFISGDPIPAAKGIDEISKKYPSLVIKGGILDGAVLDQARAKSLAKVKPRDVLLAELAGLLQASTQQLANLLSAPVRQLGYVLAAYKQKLEKDAPPKAATEPAAVEAEPQEEATPEAEPATEAAAQEPETAAPEPDAPAAEAEAAAPEPESEAAAPTPEAPAAEPEAEAAAPEIDVEKQDDKPQEETEGEQNG